MQSKTVVWLIRNPSVLKCSSMHLKNNREFFHNSWVTEHSNTIKMTNLECLSPMADPNFNRSWGLFLQEEGNGERNAADIQLRWNYCPRIALTSATVHTYNMEIFFKKACKGASACNTGGRLFLFDSDLPYSGSPRTCCFYHHNSPTYCVWICAS